jgi:hypothetical protein
MRKGHLEGQRVPWTLEIDTNWVGWKDVILGLRIDRMLVVVCSLGVASYPMLVQLAYNRPVAGRKSLTLPGRPVIIIIIT